MARNKVAPIRTGKTGSGTYMGLGLSGPIFCDRSAHPRAGRLSDIRIDDRRKPFALVQGNGFRPAVDIKTNHADQAGSMSQMRAARSLIAVSKQLVG
ncbi:hypothetical protein [Acidisoma silvae]|uniref:Uncharacterized protein n=1 Tax=Acidisoma silvae TaxID=2802396 RepID=A0A963YT80_9PROT|nr:hypothetical protein [Acidisoma silvae]MCB8876637.1 hypothetical protein [Acidisoma silvae]